MIGNIVSKYVGGNTVISGNMATSGPTTELGALIGSLLRNSWTARMFPGFLQEFGAALAKDSAISSNLVRTPVIQCRASS